MKRLSVIPVFTTVFVMCAFACSKDVGRMPKPIAAADNPINISQGYGILEAGKYFQLSPGDTLIPWTDFAVVQLYDTLTPFINMTSYAGFGGDVSVNNILLKKNWKPNVDSVLTYYDTTEAFFNTPFAWRVTGSQHISGFKYSANTFPTFDNYKDVFPDEIDISKDLRLNFGAYSADEIEITLGGIGGNLKRKLIYPTNEVSITLPDLSGRNIAEIQIVLYRNNFQDINGKIYNFRTRLGILDQSIPLVTK